MSVRTARGDSMDRAQSSSVRLLSHDHVRSTTFFSPSSPFLPRPRHHVHTERAFVGVFSVAASLLAEAVMEMPAGGGLAKRKESSANVED
ncbi:hypothetical protein BGW80DRAFT_1454995 [Lactifluus volemus]|nr:hypothetical protein BGW80DRAFT_1454995 [Lactifluus volemus]